MFPIRYFQENALSKEVVHLVAVVGNNLILLLMMYGKRIYVILFNSEINTKEHNRQEGMKHRENKRRSTTFIYFNFYFILLKACDK